MHLTGIPLALTSTLAVLCSLSFFVSARFNRRFEEVVPLTAMGTVAILYVFGLVGQLRAGVYAVLAMSLVLYALAGHAVVSRRAYRRFFALSLTPAFFVFVTVFIGLAFLHNGRMLLSWDEFSHWGDVVKAMYALDAFAVDPASGSYFASYPPGMALFQYFGQVVAGGFHESLLYVGYQAFCLALVMPFLKNLRPRNVLASLATVLVILIAPTIFNNDYYTTIYVDSALGAVFGFGLATVYVNREYDLLASAALCFGALMLVLLKDIGLYLALGLVVVVLLDVVIAKAVRPDFASAGRLVRSLKPALVVPLLLLAIAAGELSWKHVLAERNVEAQFSQPVVVSELADVVSGRDQTYRTETADKFLAALHTQPLAGGSLPLTSGSAFGLAVAALWFLRIGDEDKKRSGVLVVTVLCGCVAFLGVLLLAYLFKFRPSEAVMVPSFSRYVSTYFSGMLMLIVLRVALGQRTGRLILLLSFLIASAQIGTIGKLFLNSTGRSIAVRQPYEAVVTKYRDLTGPGRNRVYVVAQNDSGYQYWVLRFSLRPNSVNENFSWSLGTPYGSQDIWTKTIRADEWMDELVSRFDYVLLYQSDDQFIREFGQLFRSATGTGRDAIKNGGVYRVNRSERSLDLLGP